MQSAAIQHRTPNSDHQPPGTALAAFATASAAHWDANSYSCSCSAVCACCRPTACKSAGKTATGVCHCLHLPTLLDLRKPIKARSKEGGPRIIHKRTAASERKIGVLHGDIAHIGPGPNRNLWVLFCIQSVLTVKGQRAEIVLSVTHISSLRRAKTGAESEGTRMEQTVVQTNLGLSAIRNRSGGV
eukprot:6486207-Amphidinium_carterae.1